MERFGSLLGIFGLVILGFGVLGGFVTSFLLPFNLFHLVFGAVLVTAWFAISGVKHLRDARQVVTGRTSRFGANALLYIAVFIGILGVANWYVQRHDVRWDLTEEGVYSLAPQTRSVIDGLKKPLKLVGFSLPEQGDRLQEVLDLYRAYAPDKVTVELIDPRAKPHLVDTYEMKPGNVIYIGYGEGKEKGESRVNEITEDAITNSIIKLTRGEAKKVYIVQGHDEPSPEDEGELGIKNLVLALGDDNLRPEPIVLGEHTEVPGDAGAVLLVAPKKPLLPQEKEMLIRYGDAGGRLLLLHEPRTTRDVVDIAGHFGVAVRSDVIVDQQRTLFGAALGIMPTVRDYSSTNGATKAMTQQHVTVFFNASSVAPVGGAKGDEYDELCKTGPTAWGETDVERLFAEEPQVSFDDSDNKGPLALAVAYQKVLEEGKKGDDTKSSEDEGPKFKKMTRVIVVGDSDWLTNRLIGNYSNRDLALNFVNWLAGEDGGVSIRARSLRESLAPIPRETFMKILGGVVVLPELFLMFGLYVWWNRRRESVA